MSELTRLTLAAARDGLRDKSFSSVELTQAFLDAIAQSNKHLNAYIEVTADQALAGAGDSDARIARGEARALEGLPLGIKDLFATEGVHTQAGSHILDGFKPAYESTVTQNLWDAGADHVGQAQHG